MRVRLGLLGLVVAFAAGCATFGSGLEAPEVDVVGLAPLERTGVEQRVRVDLRLRNPNNHALTFEGIRFQLSIAGEPVGQALSSETITVPRLGEAVTSVTTTTTQLALVESTTTLVEGGQLDYAVTGKLYLRDPKAKQIAFRETGSLPGAGFVGAAPPAGE